ncbi:tyrosine-type recombinase/integrase [bacterium]|nr:tyrosine-type recombinase/integrase [bacterium]
MRRVDESLSTIEVAEDLRIGRATAFRWCESGKLPAIKIGRSWRIPLEPYLQFKKQFVHTQDVTAPNLAKLINEWEHHLRNGARPLSPVTVKDYLRDFRRYLRLIGGGSTPTEIVNKDALSRALEGLPITSFANRYNIFYAVNSFAKYLIGRDLLPSEVHAQLKPLRPRRYFPARKTVMDAEQINRFLAAIWVANGNSEYERQLNFAICKTFLNLGVRNQELCDLRLADVDLNKRSVVVRLGKGAKTRYLGINQELAKVLTEYLQVRPKCPVDNLFVTESGRKLSPGLISRRVRRLAVASGVDITPHGLRRTWVTQSALQGRSLAIISHAAGHRQISTTQGYLMISEQQVVSSMVNW